MNDLTKIMMDLGLNKNEATIYMTSLQSGPSTAMSLSKTTQIKCSTVYVALERLLKLGLIYIDFIGKKRLFIASDPKLLRNILESKAQRLEQSIPQLTTLFNQLSKSESLIKHYQGLDAIKTIYNNILHELNTDDFYYVISDQEKWHKLAPEFFDNFIIKRAKQKFDLKLILQDTAIARKTIEKQGEQRNIKLLPPNYELNVNMIVLPNKVIMIQTKEPLIALVIDNEHIVEMNKILFEVIWNSQ